MRRFGGGVISCMTGHGLLAKLLSQECAARVADAYFRDCTPRGKHRPTCDLFYSTAIMAVFPRAETTVSLSPEYLAESNASKILAIVGVLCFLALVTVALRLFVRVALLRYTGPDDFVLAIAMVSRENHKLEKEYN